MDTADEAVTDNWTAVIDDMEATANEYRAAGWTVIELHPGDVTGSTDEPAGFDVVVPDNEFAQLESAVEDAAFDDTELFGATHGGTRFVLSVTFDSENEFAVCCPLYFDGSVARSLAQTTTDGLVTRIRPLTNDRAVTIEYHDPDPLFPEELTDQSA